MKTFKMIGMALMALIMCVNFVSCDNDDPTGDSPAPKPANEKKLVRVMQYIDNTRLGSTIEFKYNEQGYISEAIFSYNEGYGWKSSTYKCNWDYSNNSMIVLKEEQERYKYTLSNGKIISYTDQRWEESTYYTYDKNGYIIDAESEEYTTTYTWNNGKLSMENRGNEEKSNDTYIRYSQQTCKGYFPSLGDYTSLDDLYMVHPELCGAKMNYLPSTITDNSGTYTLNYEFDSEGYVISYSESHSEWGIGDTYEFVWE